MDIMFRSSPHFPPLCQRSSRDHVNEIICSKITHTELITQNSSNCSGSEPGSLRRSWWLWEGAQPHGRDSAACAKVLKGRDIASPCLLLTTGMKLWLIEECGRQKTSNYFPLSP